MQVYLNSITGIEDSISSMFFSKGTWDYELQDSIQDTVEDVNNRYGKYNNRKEPANIQYEKWLDTLFKFGRRHITLLRFIDFSFIVEGMHRAGQDDWDAHAMRFENRIIRMSTRLASSDSFRKRSEYYEDKILSMDDAIKILNKDMPDNLEYDGNNYVRAVNGYIREDLKDVNDVKRGLYMESFPSNFIFKVNLTQFAHVFKERNSEGAAHPEVKRLAEHCLYLINIWQPKITRELLLDIKN